MGDKWRARQDKPAVKPLYTAADAERVLGLRKALNDGQPTEIAPGVELTYHEAGHTLGSASVERVVQGHHISRRLMFSGDLGNTCPPLMRLPAIIKQADLAMLESTYGDRDHRCSQDILDELAEILQQAHRDGSDELNPSFAEGRTQDLIYYLGQGRLPQQAVFLDSPMAIRANAIYSRHHE